MEGHYQPAVAEQLCLVDQPRHLPDSGLNLQQQFPQVVRVDL